MTQSLPPPTVSAPDARSLGASIDAEDSLERLAEDLLTDPCHRLRRACQIADYGASATGGTLDARSPPK